MPFTIVEDHCGILLSPAGIAFTILGRDKWSGIFPQSWNLENNGLGYEKMTLAIDFSYSLAMR